MLCAFVFLTRLCVGYTKLSPAVRRIFLPNLRGKTRRPSFDACGARARAHAHVENIAFFNTNGHDVKLQALPRDARG